MNLLAWIIVGLIAGFLAQTIMRGRGGGLVSDILIGIIGALLGGFLASALLGVRNPLTGIDVTTIAIATIGAIILLAILRNVPRRRRRLL